MDHTIARVAATPVSVPVGFDWAGSRHVRRNPFCCVEIETRDGLVGHGVSALSPAPVVAAMVETVAAPVLLGRDARDIEGLWRVLDWALTAPGQTGIGCNALSAVDIALWDIRGKLEGLPVWKLLGGARREIPAYATCGFAFFDRDQLAAAGRHMVGRGYDSLKVQVGRPGLDAREAPVPLDAIVAEDLSRLRSLRDAVGEGVEIAMDAGARLDLDHAVALSAAAAELGVGFFEEPLVENDPRAMAELRRRAPVPVACGQSEGRVARFRDMIAHGAIDIVQPNVICCGGFTGAAQAAALAAENGLPVFHGGGATYHNAHLQAGLAAGTGIEHQMSSAPAAELLFEGVPPFVGGALVMTDAPGLGFAPRPDALRAYRIA